MSNQSFCNNYYKSWEFIDLYNVWISNHIIKEDETFNYLYTIFNVVHSMPAGNRITRPFLFYTLFFIYGVIGRHYTAGFIEIVREKPRVAVGTNVTLRKLPI